MKKQVVIALGAICALSATTAANAAGNITAPSFGFVQEMAGVTAKGDLRADLYNTTGAPTTLRLGAFGGEVILDPTGGATATGIGYKHPFNPNMAAYGKLYIQSGGTSVTNLTLGFAYTGTSGNFLYNGNAELFNQSAGGTSTAFFNLKGAGFLRLQQKAFAGSMLLGGEIDLRMSPSPTWTNLFLGARWEPKRNVLVDAGLAGSTAGTTTIGTPAFVRLNIGF